MVHIYVLALKIMKLDNLHEILLALNFIVVQIVVTPVTSNLSYENKNFAKIKQDPTRYHLASAYRNRKPLFATRNLNKTTTREINNNVHAYVTPRLAPLGASGNYSQIKTIIRNNNQDIVSPPNQYKKWQVGRVSRKQYEIINMLWRKTKIFVDVDSTTAVYNFRPNNETEKKFDSRSALRQTFDRLPSRPNVPSTTPSYIEFYYLDETDERFKQLTTPKYTQYPRHIRGPLRNLGNFKFVLADSPMFAFHIDDSNFKRSTRSAIPTRYMQPTNRMKRRRTRTHDASLTDFDPLNSLTPSYNYPRKFNQQNKVIVTTTKGTIKSIENSVQNMNKSLSTAESLVDPDTCPTTTVALTTENYTTESSHKINVTHVTKPTTAYDKIKFFEIYDQQTPLPYYDAKGRLIDMDNDDIFVKGNELYGERILLEHVDQSIGNEHSNPHKVKHAKKHIIDDYKSDAKDQSNDNSVVTQITKKPVTFNITKLVNVTKQPMMKLLLSSELKKTNSDNCTKSVRADWSQYSFAAAYVYEPLQVHCDAAGISPHWLVTAGSCLSRRHKTPGGEGRSAFVTYCGEAWWNPERMAYVKYSVVHPRFQPRDRTRRHLYNIGLIQVVTSMASACYGWSPLSLMSHQFIADVEGSIANAIGWGLDRFDTRYSSSELPKSPLMTYESKVFSDSCPGNVGYSKAKRLDEEGGVKNVYCLTLPPYSGEDTDPVHGALLLVGGKLVALYLQEERRPWGNQCAQYTGTWRLVPWVVDIARENEEVDNFTLDI